MAVAVDSNGRTASLQVDEAGNLKIAGTFSADPPVGGATEAKQDDLIAAIEGITIPPPVGGATEAKQDDAITKLTALDTNAGAPSDAAVAAGAVGSMSAKLRAISRDIGAFLAQLPASLGKKAVSASLAANAKSGGDEYETVAASQTDQVLGATGATGDYIEGVLCVVSTAATSQVQLKDGAGSAITILPNSVGAGVGSYYVPLGLTSVAGAWKLTTAAGVSAIAMGDFT